MTTTLDRFESRFIPEPNSGCWLYVGHHMPDGYGQFDALGTLGEKRAHRVSWTLYRGAIPEGINVLHRCDVRCCVNPDHLWLGTKADNYKDMVAKGRDHKAWGETAGHSKLSADQVRAIRADNRPRKDVASVYGLHPRYVGQIVNRRKWANLP